QASNSSNFSHQNMAQPGMRPQDYYHGQFEQQSDHNINKVQQQINNESSEQMCKEIMERYIKEYKGVIDFENPTACSPCYHVWLGDSDGLRYHLQNKNDVNNLYHFGGSKNHLVLIASEHCDGEKMIEIFNILKEFGADFNVTSKEKCTALHNLVLKSKLSIQNDLESIKTIISFLVDNRCNINARDFSKRTILINCLSKKYNAVNDISIIDLLLKKGADPNISCEFTLPEPYFAPNALFIAIKNKWPNEVLDLLLNHGANIDQLDKNGYHLLLWTVMDKKDKNNKKNKESKDEMKPCAMDWVLEHSYEASDPKNLGAAEKYISRNPFSTKRRIFARWKNRSPEYRQRVKEICEQREQRNKNLKK
ncbi:5281_t:CDS:1, partial [Dentiscutata erythropus]